MQQTWCIAVASAQVSPEGASQVHQWLVGDDRVVVVPLADPVALATWAQARDGLERLVFVGKTAHAPAMAIAANLLTGHLPRLEVSTSTWPTTTLSLAALSARVHETATSAHAAVAQLQHLVPAAWAGVWMPTVTALDEPRPTFAQHLRSMLPGGPGFLATLTPDVRVLRLAATTGSPAASGSTLIAGGRLPDRDLNAVQCQAGVSQMVELPAVEDGESQYGSAEAVELVLMPDAPGPKSGRPSSWCQVCRSPVWGDFCPFCRVAVVRYQGVA